MKIYYIWSKKDPTRHPPYRFSLSAALIIKLIQCWALSVNSEILTNLSTLSSNSSIDISFNETSLDKASYAYHFIFRTNDSSSLVLNMSSFTVDDKGGAKILVAVESLVDDDSLNTNDRYYQPIDLSRKWMLQTWSGPCTGGSLLTSNTTQIHLMVYQLIPRSRFVLKATVCAFSPCIISNSVGKNLSPNVCLSSAQPVTNAQPRAFHTLLPYSDCLYAFGGISAANPLLDLPTFYSKVSPSDTNCGRAILRENQFPISRRFLSTIVTAPAGSSRIFVLGGIGTTTSPLSGSDGYIYYNLTISTSSTWFTMASLHLFGHAACAITNSRVFVYGGATFDGAISSSLLQWRQRWGNWRKVIAIYGTPPPPLFGHSLTCYENKLFIFGGFSLTSTSRVSPNQLLYRYEIAAKRWSILSALEPRFFHSTVLLPARFNNTEELANGSPIIAFVGGTHSSDEIAMFDTRCSVPIKADLSEKLSIGSGAGSYVSPLQSDPHFRILSSGGINGTSIYESTPKDLKVKLPIVNRKCANKPQTSDSTSVFWRCGLAINPAVYFQSNSSRYYYDVYLQNSQHDSFFLDVDTLANVLSGLSSSSVEWTVQCRGWLRLDSMTSLNLVAASIDKTGRVEQRSLNFRFAIYLFVDGNLIRTYLPSSKVSPPSLPLIDTDDNSVRGNIGNGIFQVSIFLHGFGPIIPSGTNIQLQSSISGATYLLPTTLLSTAVAELACSSPASQFSCIICLLNAACSWIPSPAGNPGGQCIAQRLEASSDFNLDDESNTFEVIRDPSACPSCFAHSTYCRDCTYASSFCSWLPGLDICSPSTIVYDVPEATTTCPHSCFQRRNCDECVGEGHLLSCLWSVERSVCVDYWLAEASVPFAIGATLGCPTPSPTTPAPSTTTTVCSEDNSWCGPLNDVCVALVAAGKLDYSTTLSPTANPIDAFPMFREDLTSTTTPEPLSNYSIDFLSDGSIDPKMMLLNRLKLNTSDVCSGHGKCIPPGRCLCDVFWQGDSCTKECRCYGDAKCPDPNKPEICMCPPGSTGTMCERCISGYTGNPKNGIPCRSCQTVCNKNADTCVSRKAIIEQNLTDATPSEIIARKLPIAEEDSDIMCVGCRDYTRGNLCQNCITGYFRPVFFGRVDLVAKCQPCICHDHSTVCNEVGGLGCQCEDNTRTAYGVPYTLGCASCSPPFVGDPRFGRPCYLPVSQNQLLCLWQDGAPVIASKLLSNATDTSNLCRSSRDSLLMPSTSMHLATAVPITNELRIFLGIVSGKVDIVMTLNPSGLRPPPKNLTRRALSNVSFDRQRRAVAPTTTKSSLTYASGAYYDSIMEGTPIQNNGKDAAGDSIIFVSRAQLTAAPITIRGVTGRMLVVVTPPNDRFRTTDDDSSDFNSAINQAVVFYLRITAVSPTTLRARNINDDTYYSFTAAESAAGEAVAGVVVFRQDQVQIDVFVFFSVFLALFVLLLLGLLLVIRFHAVLGERRRLRARQQRKARMIRRPFGVSWPRFDLPLLIHQVSKMPVKVADLLIPNLAGQPIPEAANQDNKTMLTPPRKTATVVSLQPTSNLHAAVTTVLIKLPVSRPVLPRQISTASGFNVNEQTAIVTSVPPPPMAFGTLIMRVVVQEQKKAPTGRKNRIVSPVKPGQRPMFERDPTEIPDEPYPLVTPSPVQPNALGSAGNPSIRQNTRSTLSVGRTLNTPSSVTLPRTPDTVISTRDDGGDDLDELIDDIIGSSNASEVARDVMGASQQPRANRADKRPIFGRGRPLAAVANKARVVGILANQSSTNSTPRRLSVPEQHLIQASSRQSSASSNASSTNNASLPLVPPLQTQPSLAREDTASTSITFKADASSVPSTWRSEAEEGVLIPELPDTTAVRSSRGGVHKKIRGGGTLANALATAARPPLPPSAKAIRRKATALRRQSVPSQSRRLPSSHSNAIYAPYAIMGEEDSAI